MFRIPDEVTVGGTFSHAGLPSPTGIQKSICSFLERITYRVMASEEDVDAICKLRYESYRSMDLIADCDGGRWRDDLDDHPGYRNIGVYLEGELAGGIRINRITPDFRLSMALEMYPTQIGQMLSQGRTFVEGTRLFTAPALGRRHRELPFAIIRLVGLAGRHYQATHVLKNVQANHVSFYQRHLRAEVVPDSLMPYKDHSREVELVLVTAEVEPSRTAMLGPMPYLLSTRREMEALFAERPSDAAVAPGVRAALTGNERPA
jgi:hypothetical protein